MTDMTGYRKAAVALHGLHEEDRRWVLAELPEADRSTLVTYLDELKALGFTGEATVERNTHPVKSISPQQPVDFIRDASAAEMHAILDSEPSSLVAQVLAIENWRWKTSFMQMCSPMRQDRIRAALSPVQTSAPARRQFLIGIIGNRIKENRTATVVDHPARSGRKAADAMKQALSSFLHRVKTWKR